MLKKKTPETTRRSLLVASLAASVPPDRVEAAGRGMMPAAEGQPGPGRILVWVDEEKWRALIRAANALGSGPD